MDSTTFLHRYQLSIGENGQPIALHRGPSGVTYRAEDIETDQPVAVKLMPTYSFEAAELQQLEAEARAAQKVDHPNIARLYDFGFSGNDVVFVTELLDGTTLDTWVAEHGPLPAAAVLRIAQQVVAGLAAAAFHSVVHRAMQPANLMIVPGQTPEGEWPFVKVLNFGGVPPTLSNSAVSFGQGGPSPQFAAPEQLEGKPADFRSELYSLGCTMWFLLTGVMPTPGAVDKGGVVPKALRPLLAQLVALDPMQRPQDPVALQQQLHDALAAVERRDGIARKFGVAPAAATPAAVAAAVPLVPETELAPAGEASKRAFLKPLALAAAVLLLAGLAAMALPSLLRSRQQAQAEPIGVPVGVPDASAAPVAKNATAAMPATAAATGAPQFTPAPADVASTEANTAANTAAAQTDESANVASASASPQPTAATTSSDAADQSLVSVLPPAPVDTASSSADQAPSAAPAENATPPATVASTNNSANSANTIETAPPAEAPASVQDDGSASSSRTRSSQNDVAETSRDADAAPNRSSRPKRTTSTSRDLAESSTSRDRAPQNSEAKTSATPARAAKPAPKRPSQIVRNEVRPAEPVDDTGLVNAPPVPRGAKRARYLGTTPEGDLIFGLPSDQRGFVSPPTMLPDTHRARRARPVVAAPSPGEEVRPAEPVEPGDQ